MFSNLQFRFKLAIIYEGDENQTGTGDLQGWTRSITVELTLRPSPLLNSSYKSLKFPGTVCNLLGGRIFYAVAVEVWHRQRKEVSIDFHSNELCAMTISAFVDLVNSRLLPDLEYALNLQDPINL